MRKIKMRQIIVAIYFVVCFVVDVIASEPCINIANNQSGAHCFNAQTMIATLDGEKMIEQLKFGDKILTYNYLTKKIEPAIVDSIAFFHHHEMVELVFDNGVIIQTTEDHPFFSDGIYYSVMAHNNYGLTTKKMKVGQKFDFLGKNKIIKVKLKEIKPYSTCEDTYAIVLLDKNTLFFANGVCVSVETSK